MSPPKAWKQATIYDVAREAKVHISTVSRALNNPGRVNPATASRIQAVVKRLGFVPSATASNLAAGRSRSIAVLVPSFFSDFATLCLRAIERRWLGSELQLKVFSAARFTTDRRPRSEVVDLLKQVLVSGMADGAIVISTGLYSRALVAELARRRYPLVLVEGKEAWGQSVRADNASGAAMGVEHLLKAGRRRILLVTGDTRKVLSARERLEGCREAFRKAGSRPERWQHFQLTDYSDEDKAAEVLRYAVQEGFDAIFSAAGDPFALALLQEAQRQRIAVPGRLAVLGFDDLPEAALAGLTTIRQPIQQMAEAAFDALTRSLKDPSSRQPSAQVFACALVPRRSA